MPSSSEPIISIPIQGPFDLDDPPIECFFFQAPQDWYNAQFFIYRLEIKYGITLNAFRDTDLPIIFHERGWEPLTSLNGVVYPHYVYMFYANIHSDVVWLTFQVSMYNQTILVTLYSIRQVLHMHALLETLPQFFFG